MVTPGAPKRPDDDLLVIVRVVQVAVDLVEIQPSNSRDWTQLIGSADAGQQSDQIERDTKLKFKELPLIAVLQPPSMFPVDLVARRKGERNATAGQRDLSSRRTSAASSSRPASTSASD